MELSIRDTLVILVHGDITDLAVDAIVNAANSNLTLGSGVAGAIRSKGGPTIQTECNQIGGIHVGGAVITGAGDLAAKYVIHAVGPTMGIGDEDRLLTDATKSALEIAESKSLRSIAFPAISTGVFGYPVDRCAKVMLSAVYAHLKGGSDLDRVMFCLYDSDTYAIFDKELERLASG